jgi:NNP family nitrate/nitrite transporter-like MFS transporter
MSQGDKTKYATMALIAICIGFLAPSYAQYQLSPLGSSLMRELGITEGWFSSLFTAPMLPAIFLSLVAGVLIDRKNPRLVIGTTLVLSTAGAALNLLGDSYGQLFLGFALTGLSAAFLNSSGAKLIGAWYEPQEVSGKLGIANSFSTIGMTLALATTALFPSRKAAFLVALVVFVVATIAWFLLYRSPAEVGLASSDTAPSGDAKADMGPSLGEQLRKVISDRHVWVVGLALFFILGANVVMSSLIPTILAGRGISSVSAGYYSSAYTIGCFLGCIVGPMLAKKLGGTRRTLVILTLLAGVLVAFGWQAAEGVLLVIALLCAGLLLGGTIPLLMSVPINLPEIGPQLAGTAGGIVATIQLLGAVILPTYVLIPLSGGTLATTFLLAGGCCAIAACLSLLISKEA